MKSRVKARRLIALWVSILVIGCRTTPEIVREPLDPSDPRPGAWLEALHERAQARSSLRGAVRLSLDAPDLRFRRPQRLALRRPADLRVEILGLFGQIAAVLVTNGNTYQSFDAARGDIETGHVTADLLWRLARVDLQPAEAVDLLLGAPLPSRDAAFAGAFIGSDGSLGLHFRDPSGALRERIEFDAQGRLIQFVRFAPGEEIAWGASFSDYRDVSGETFAFDVRLQFPEVDAEATLRFDHAALGLELADELFALRLADGAATQ
ncbi:MAG: hypothetical protein GY944_16030 [bacterium]|nr:hypothetical protein [bacterium]